MVDDGPAPGQHAGGGGRRRLPLPALVGLIVGFLLVPQFLALFVVGPDDAGSSYGSVRSALRLEVLPDLGGAVIAVAAIAWLRWGDRVRHERLRTRRWVLVVPVAMVVGPLALADYGHLGDVGTGLAVTLVVGTLVTALSEELMFRGIALQAFRDRYREGRAALLTALVFGGFHLLNIVVIGAAAVVQALLAVGLGYLIYLARRASGGIVVPVVVHWVWNLSLFSETVGTDGDVVSGNAFPMFLLTLALLGLVGVRRRSIDPPHPAAA